MAVGLSLSCAVKREKRGTHKGEFTSWSPALKHLRKCNSVVKLDLRNNCLELKF